MSTSVTCWLGNSPAICRKCCIHPAIVDAFTTEGLYDCKRKGLSAEEVARLKYLQAREGGA